MLGDHRDRDSASRIITIQIKQEVLRQLLVSPFCHVLLCPAKGLVITAKQVLAYSATLLSLIHQGLTLDIPHFPVSECKLWGTTFPVRLRLALESWWSL